MSKFWITFWAVVIVSFIVLGWAGTQIYHQRPPIPESFKTPNGEIIATGQDITAGQNVWQSLGGMESGSIWGHGSYVAPDWTADWLHRECVFILNEWSATDYQMPYDRLDPEQQAMLRARLTETMKTNTYDPTANTITIDPVRGRAFEANVEYYRTLFSQGDSRQAIPAATLTDAGKARQMASFFFWSSWAASTNRPGKTVTFTSNWPHEPLIGNIPSSDAIIWTGFSIIMLLAGIGLLVWYNASRKREPVAEKLPDADPLLGMQPTPSQKAVIKYFWVVSGLFLV